MHGLKNHPLLLIAALLLALSARAEEPLWYDVEVIVFAQAAPDLASERWPEEPGLPDLEGAIDLFSPGSVVSGGTGFEPLGEEALRLADARAKLEQSGKYTPLLHVAWRQPGLPRERAVTVRLHKEMTMPDHSTSAQTVSPLTAEGDDRRLAQTQAADASLGEAGPTPRLDGTLRLVLSRYLHLEADLVYALPVESRQEQVYPLSEFEGHRVDPASADEAFGPVEPMSWLQGYRLQESRRMRSREIHYLDHPLFGIIATVTPVEKPVEPPPARPAPVHTPASSPTTPSSSPKGMVKR